MKDETRKLFAILRDPNTYHPAIYSMPITSKIMELEEKLLQVEKYLNLGGFIADKNGKACKHGDMVYVTDSKGDKWKAELKFYELKKCFIVEYEWPGKRKTFEVLSNKDFELAEQIEKIDI